MRSFLSVHLRIPRNCETKRCRTIPSTVEGGFAEGGGRGDRDGYVSGVGVGGGGWFGHVSNGHVSIDMTAQACI